MKKFLVIVAALVGIGAVIGTDDTTTTSTRSGSYAVDYDTAADTAADFDEQDIMAFVWDTYDADTQITMCIYVNAYGVENAAQDLSDGADGEISADAAAEFLTGVCR